MVTLCIGETELAKNAKCYQNCTCRIFTDCNFKHYARSLMPSGAIGKECILLKLMLHVKNMLLKC